MYSMEEIKYCISIKEVKEGVKGIYKKHRIEIDNDGSMVTLKTPDRVIHTAFCNILRWIQEGSMNEESRTKVTIED